MKKILCLISLFLLGVTLYASPITGLLERIDKGASRKFVIERLKGEKDFFELDQKGNKVVVRGNNYVSIATGINWYLKYYAGINLSWNGMQADLPEVLPPVLKKERHETDLKLRYDFNYCTFSYSMAFWDWKRWEQEIDWMALICRLQWLEPMWCGRMCWRNWVTHAKKSMLSLRAPVFRPGG